jgi:hypothetical protein
MRIEFAKIDSLLMEELSPFVVELSTTLDRRMHGPITPNDEIVINARYLVRSAKKEVRMALALASWWLGDFGGLIREELRKDPEDDIQLTLRAKSIGLEVLSQRYSERDFFGNLLPKMRKVCSKLTFLRRQQVQAHRTIRHRGYRDHGTLRPESSWFETSDWSFTEQQNQIEETRSLREDTLAILEGFLMG